MVLNERSGAGDAAARRAVVDIGSNSVRLVVYNGPQHAPFPICNEKALCGLGRDMGDDGTLNPAAVEDALATLKRFRRLLDEFGDPPVRAIATAAVREARDGKEFVGRANAIGFDVRIISGQEEAMLTAMGVASFEPGATGLVGDMGGGSLELVALKKGAVSKGGSYPLGPFHLMRAVGGEIDKAAALAEKAAGDIDWLEPGKFKTLYSVGGAWRALARIHMRVKDHPLSVLHHYELPGAEAIEVCDLVARQSRRSLAEIPGISRRRLDTLPYAAVVLKAVIRRAGVKRLLVSAGGVREGLLYQELSNADRARDPLLEACRFYAERLAPEPDFGPAAMAAIDPLFADDSRKERRLREAICLLVDIGAYFHPDLRALHAFDTALRAPFAGISHRERVIAGLALYRRHEGRSAPKPREPAVDLLSEEDQRRATTLGLALRFAAAFSPKAAAPLRGVRLSLEDGKLVFSAPAARKELMGEFPRKRFVSLAAAFDAEPVERYED